MGVVELRQEKLDFLFDHNQKRSDMNPLLMVATKYDFPVRKHTDDITALGCHGNRFFIDRGYTKENNFLFQTREHTRKVGTRSRVIHKSHDRAMRMKQGGFSQQNK